MHSPPRPVLVYSTSLNRHRVENPLQSHAKQKRNNNNNFNIAGRVTRDFLPAGLCIVNQNPPRNNGPLVRKSKGRKYCDTFSLKMAIYVLFANTTTIRILIKGLIICGHTEYKMAVNNTIQFK